jgi:hypothetical protein
MRIRLNKSVYVLPKGSVHEVKRIVPHGGYSDSEKQYVVEGPAGEDVHVISDNAEEIKG